LRPKKYRKKFHSDAAEGKNSDKETHEEELATEVTDLDDFTADVLEQPLKIETTKKLKKYQ
jgi:hypothetical protein